MLLNFYRTLENIGVVFFRLRQYFANAFEYYCAFWNG